MFVVCRRSVSLATMPLQGVVLAVVWVLAALLVSARGVSGVRASATFDAQKLRPVAAQMLRTSVAE